MAEKCAECDGTGKVEKKWTDPRSKGDKKKTMTIVETCQECGPGEKKK